MIALMCLGRRRAVGYHASAINRVGMEADTKQKYVLSYCHYLAIHGDLVNELIQSIQQDILSTNVSLTNILLKAKVLAYQLKNDEFKQWVKNELDGYDSIDSEGVEKLSFVSLA
jgi:hypothetical protein